ncbi:hypothetical protein A6770_34320 [Nostoc minutum NIES-26]|uniref:Uncharacterized protein n=1 Tax=Nostoc minutum NIES-26 TaxID=1844469 RepID=A0A367PZI0_9NOSO|nr:hypothetical protein [Dendronalium sp. ChiSLP03b]MDZ8209413.1 hypothetical protein [Dendronalium sp. ChiSLP03b]RCJ17319.1 hypothetical protein A6770_34320 [Nostoc minutum NIES-26]
MMTHVQGVIAAKVDSQSNLKHYVEQKADVTKSVSLENFSFQTLADVTKTILFHAFWLSEQKQNLSLKDYKKLLFDRGWKGEEKKYLKIAAAFGKFSPQDFAQVEPRTIYQLAENSKKYQQVIDRLLDLSEITQEGVRSLIKKQQTPREAKPEKPSIWRRIKNGRRYCQIPPIHEASEQTGTTLQRMMDEEGLTAQHIVAEAIALRQAYKQGQLVLAQEGVEPGE